MCGILLDRREYTAVSTQRALPLFIDRETVYATGRALEMNRSLSCTVYTIPSHEEKGCGRSAAVHLSLGPFSPAFRTKLQSVPQGSAWLCLPTAQPSDGARGSHSAPLKKKAFTLFLLPGMELLAFSLTTFKMDPSHYSRRQIFFKVTSDVFFRLVLT